MAEREGFEPSIRFWRILTFQASAFDHSATAPHALEGVRPSGAWPAPQASARSRGTGRAIGQAEWAQRSHEGHTKNTIRRRSLLVRSGPRSITLKQRCGDIVDGLREVGKRFLRLDAQAGFALRGFGGTVVA